VKQQYIKTIIVSVVSLLLASLPWMKPTSAFAGPERPKGTIQSEWPEIDFTAAYDYFEKKDFSHAAQEIRNGADFLKAASERSKGKIRNDLLRSHDELAKLSDDTEKGSVTSSSRLREAFSHAHKALAEYYHARLKASWLKRDTDKAGRELKSEASNIERALSWAGSAVEEETLQVLSEARSLGEKLAEKADWTSQEVEKGIKDIGEEIDKLEGRFQEEKPEKKGKTQ
jgi:hypothetical protein